MELARHLCERLRHEYPDDSFVAFTNASIDYGNRSLICYMNESIVSRLFLSTTQEIGNSELKSLLHRVVFDSKSLCFTIGYRAIHLFDEIQKMLPCYCISVFVTEVGSNDTPQVYGPHKGRAYFWEPEFGDHVTVVLH